MNSTGPKMVGITGGIGAGKTLVSSIFSLLSVPVYNADDRAKWLMINNLPLKLKISEAFGHAAYFEDGRLNRQYLAEIVFSDPKKTAVINGLVHPAVAKDFMTWAHNQQTRFVLKEAALLFEAGSNKGLDYIIHVTAPEALRIKRVSARDPQRGTDQIRHIIAKQFSDKKKNMLADFIITNDESVLVIPQVLKIHQKIMEPD
jgi:dephospho-CoA kinase